MRTARAMTITMAPTLASAMTMCDHGDEDDTHSNRDGDDDDVDDDDADGADGDDDDGGVEIRGAWPDEGACSIHVDSFDNVASSSGRGQATAIITITATSIIVIVIVHHHRHHHRRSIRSVDVRIVVIGIPIRSYVHQARGNQCRTTVVNAHKRCQTAVFPGPL